jgi:hypothetical protein
MLKRKQKYLTMAEFEAVLDKLHLDAEGHDVVEAFVDMNNKILGAQHANEYEEVLVLDLDLEEECLIK